MKGRVFYTAVRMQSSSSAGPEGFSLTCWLGSGMCHVHGKLLLDEL